MTCRRWLTIGRVMVHASSPCGFSELPQSEHISVADATWLALNVVSGGGSASSSQPIGVTKIAKSVIAPLADHNISVFMLSTYQTDFILVSPAKCVELLFMEILTVTISEGDGGLFFVINFKKATYLKPS